jgi:hypothetical protein
MKTMKTLSRLPAICLAFTSLSGCTVQARPAAAVVVETGYTPLYYEERVVDYDPGGRPIYYVDDTVYYVPRRYAGYQALTVHYRRHERSYRQWRTHNPRREPPRAHRRDRRGDDRR